MKPNCATNNRQFTKSTYGVMLLATPGETVPTSMRYSETTWTTTAGKARGAGPSGRYDTRIGPKRNDVALSGSQEREKGKLLSFWLSFEMEKMMDLRMVLEE